jgi:hypothetical protein
MMAPANSGATTERIKDQIESDKKIESPPKDRAAEIEKRLARNKAKGSEFQPQ